jgi:hypothetical protein
MLMLGMRTCTPGIEIEAWKRRRVLGAAVRFGMM